MSLKIDKEKFQNPELLTEQEIRYLWTHDPVRFNRLGLARPDMVEAPQEPQAQPTKFTPLELQGVPTIQDRGGIVEEEGEEDYEEGWNNNQRRAELVRRGLSVDGNKDELIARLRRADANQLEDNDYSKV